MNNNLANPEVTTFLDDLEHPLRSLIEPLRLIILGADDSLAENIKWNGPNYTSNGEDRITMKIQPPKQIQLIFHRGAKKLAQPDGRLISDTSGLLSWKENDRAIAAFKTMADIEKVENDLRKIVAAWIKAAG